MEGHGNRAKGRRWKSVIEKRLEELQAMEKVADALIMKALEGDISAIKELGDRIDGKAKQQTEITGLDGAPVMSGVEVRLVRPDAER